MRFYLPFDDVQFQAAVTAHTGFRNNLRRLRRRFQPRSPDEIESLRRYRDAIQEIGRELLKPRGKIDAERLNELIGNAVDMFVAYMNIHESRQ
jgi:hypothetical protein